MASCGVQRIDHLLINSGAPPLAPGEADSAAVGVVQDFLACHGYKAMPGPLSASRGSYGPRTTQCVKDFQQRCGLQPTGNVDQTTLRAFIEQAAPSPVASQGYLSLVLDVHYGGMTRLTSLTSQFEGAGRFGALNRNTDKAGLSFGLIQWAQKPGRLNELLKAFMDQEPQRFTAIFGSGDQGLTRRLLQHTAKPRGGTDAQGATTDPEFDLVNEPWIGRFREAALDRVLQRVQVRIATAAFELSRSRLREFAPNLVTEREIAFMLDLANQHGDGGARSIYQAAGPNLLEMENESVRRVTAQFGPQSVEVASTKARRAAFRASTLLSDARLEVKEGGSSVIITNDRTSLDESLNDPVTTIFLLAGQVGSKAAEVHALIETKEWEEYQHWFLVTDLALLTSDERQKWFEGNAADYYAVLGGENLPKVVAQHGSTQRLLNLDGRPGYLKIRKAFLSGDLV